MAGVAEPYKLAEVFNEAAFPEVAFVEPKEYRFVKASFRTPGKHITISGPSGTGKTTIVRRVLRDIGITEADVLWINGRQFADLESGLLVLAQALAAASDFDSLTELLKLVKHVVIDDFHFLKVSARTEIAKNLKLWQEKGVRFVVIGIASSADDLYSVDQELGIRNDPYEFKRQDDDFTRRLVKLDKRSFAAVAEQKARWDAAHTPEAIARQKAEFARQKARDDEQRQQREAADEERAKKEAEAAPVIVLHPTDVNTAGEADIAQVISVGPEVAAQVIAERNKRRFTDWADLVNRMVGLSAAQTAFYASVCGLTVNGKSLDGAAPNATMAAAIQKKYSQYH